MDKNRIRCIITSMLYQMIFNILNKKFFLTLILCAIALSMIK